MAHPPKWLVPAAIAAVLWNLLGCFAFAMDVARVSAGHADAARPIWSVVATGVAVIGGTLGSLALALGRRIAWPLLLASLAALVVQDAQMLASGMPPGSALALQGVVMLIAIAVAALAYRYTPRTAGT